MDWQQFDGRDAEGREMPQRRRTMQPGIRAPQRSRHIRMALGKALDMNLVDNRVAQRRIGAPLAAPVEQLGIVEYYAFWDVPRVIAPV